MFMSFKDVKKQNYDHLLATVPRVSLLPDDHLQWFPSDISASSDNLTAIMVAPSFGRHHGIIHIPPGSINHASKW